MLSRELDFRLCSQEGSRPQSFTIHVADWLIPSRSGCHEWLRFAEIFKGHSSPPSAPAHMDVASVAESWICETGCLYQRPDNNTVETAGSSQSFINESVHVDAARDGAETLCFCRHRQLSYQAARYARYKAT